MNKGLFKRMTALMSALAVTASSVLPSAAQATETADTNPEYDDIIHVIVELYGDPILAADTGDMGADYLDTAAAQTRSQQLENIRENAFSEILSIYPDAELDFTYDAVFNGFSCTLPRELLDEAEDLAAIKDVTVSEKNKLPDLNEASEGTGTGYFSSVTGLTGKGKVIAVIDTELNTGHEMFAPLEDEFSVKLTKADIADAAENRNLNFQVDPDRAYVSSKIPYAISLTDNKNRYKVANKKESMYHGTHVCGIAAGNRVMPFDDDTEMSGVAPDAQLIFMAGFEQYKDSIPTIEDTVAVAGIEDAIKLGADVVSLSFGGLSLTEQQEEMYTTVLQNANNAGVVICAAAGNDGWPTHTPENVDRNRLASPGFMDEMFTVAAASVSCMELNSIKLADGTKLPCSIMWQKAVTKDTEYEFVNCGSGSADELKANDIKGKIAVVENFELIEDPEEIADAAHNAGAAGILFCSGDEYFYNPNFESEDFFVIATNSKGSKLIRAQEDPRLFFRTDTYDTNVDTDMAHFTSHGGLQTLELKPDISAPGENIYSASYFGYEYLDGTSMATPFIAGCSALTLQYIEQNGWDVSGTEKVHLVKKLMMNSADQVRVSDIPYSPRIQGAGLVNMADLADCTVTMTNNGKASVCLGNNVGDSFSFDVNLHNYGSSDVVFSNAELEMICETTGFDEVLNADAISDIPEVLGSSASFSADTVTVPAGGETTLTVTVALDADDVSALNSVFTNGWFTEGYLTLSGADNCCDISLPITGFHGDWNILPIFGGDYSADNTDTVLIQNVLTKSTSFGRIPASASIANALSLYKNRSAEDYCPCLDPTPRHGYVISQSASDPYDFIRYNILPMRTGTITEYTITDDNGNVFLTSDFPEDCQSDEETILYLRPEDILKNGKYNLNITAELFKNPGGEKVPQTRSVGFTVDNDPPELSNISVKTEKGRKILTITAKDPELEGFYIIGTGKGCIKGSSDNSGYSSEDLRSVCQYFDPTMAYISDQNGVGSYGRNSISSATLSDVLYNIWVENENEPDYDFFDAVPAEPDENGCMTIQYDVTDLTDYTVSVADRGYNLTNYIKDMPLVSNIPGVMEVKEDTPVSKLTPPTYSFSGKVTSEGWEYFNPIDGEWTPLNPNTLLDIDYHLEKIRYAVYSGDEAGYSNTAIVSITDRLSINVSIYENNVQVMEEQMYTGHQFDPILFENDDNISYRIVMEADGYVTRVLEFKGRNTPEDFFVYVYRLGDTNGDKSVNITDIVRTAAFVKGKKMLSSYELKVADVNGDGKVNITDIIRIAARVKGIRNF
jgi:lactocepin